MKKQGIPGLQVAQELSQGLFDPEQRLHLQLETNRSSRARAGGSKGRDYRRGLREAIKATPTVLLPSPQAMDGTVHWEITIEARWLARVLPTSAVAPIIREGLQDVVVIAGYAEGVRVPSAPTPAGGPPPIKKPPGASTFTPPKPGTVLSPFEVPVHHRPPPAPVVTTRPAAPPPSFDGGPQINPRLRQQSAAFGGDLMLPLVVVAAAVGLGVLAKKRKKRKRK